MFRSRGDIARETGQTDCRIENILRTRRIEPVQKAGGVRLFDQAAFDRVVAELAVLPKPGRPRNGQKKTTIEGKS